MEVRPTIYPLKDSEGPRGGWRAGAEESRSPGRILVIDIPVIDRTSPGGPGTRLRHVELCTR